MALAIAYCSLESTFLSFAINGLFASGEREGETICEYDVKLATSSTDLYSIVGSLYIY